MAKTETFSDAQIAHAIAVGLGWKPRREPEVVLLHKKLRVQASLFDDDLPWYSQKEANRIQRRDSTRVLVEYVPDTKRSVFLKTPEQVYVAMMDVAYGRTQPNQYVFAVNPSVDNILHHLANQALTIDDKLTACFHWASVNLPNRYEGQNREHRYTREAGSRLFQSQTIYTGLAAAVQDPSLRHQFPLPRKTDGMTVRHA